MNATTDEHGAAKPQPKKLTAETQSSRRKKGENGILCGLRVSAVKKMLKKRRFFAPSW